MFSNTHEVYFRIDDVHNTKIEVYNMNFDAAVRRAGDIVQSCYPDAKVEFQWAHEIDRTTEGDRFSKVTNFSGWNN
jgi:hypothetical protein